MPKNIGRTNIADGSKQQQQQQQEFGSGESDDDRQLGMDRAVLHRLDEQQSVAYEYRAYAQSYKDTHTHSWLQATGYETTKSLCV